MSEFIRVSEAEKKICPFLSIAQPQRDSERNCIGDKCMMWRWGIEEAETDNGRTYTQSAMVRIKNEPCPNCPNAANKDYCNECLVMERYGYIREYEAVGYCGLAPLGVDRL